MVDDELAEQQPGAVRPVCSKHGVMDDVVGGTDVTAAGRLGARRSAQLAWLTRDVRVTEDHPHDIQVQRLASADPTAR